MPGAARRPAPGSDTHGRLSDGNVPRAARWLKEMSGPGDLCPRVSHNKRRHGIPYRSRVVPLAARRPAPGPDTFSHSRHRRSAMKGDRVEIVIDAGSGTTRTYDVDGHPRRTQGQRHARPRGRRGQRDHPRRIDRPHRPVPGQPRARAGRAPGRRRPGRRRDHPQPPLRLSPTLHTASPMTSPAAGARPDDDRRTGSTTPADGAPRRPRRRRGGRGRTRQNTSLQDTHGQAASGVPAADAAASPGGATPDSAAPGGAAVDPAGGAAPSIDARRARAP